MPFFRFRRRRVVVLIIRLCDSETSEVACAHDAEGVLARASLRHKFKTEVVWGECIEHAQSVEIEACADHFPKTPARPSWGPALWARTDSAEGPWHTHKNPRPKPPARPSGPTPPTLEYGARPGTLWSSNPLRCISVSVSSAMCV
jgi:hypothetical protein